MSLLHAAPRTWLRLRWPREVEVSDVRAALAALHGLSLAYRSSPLVLRTVGASDGLRHYLGVPSDNVKAAIAQLRQALPGGSIVEADLDESEADMTLVARLVSSSPSRALHTDEPERAAAVLLRSLVCRSRAEQLVLQVELGPVRRPLITPAEVPLPWSLTTVLSGSVSSTSADSRRAYREKFGVPGWRARLLVGVRAESMVRGRKLIGVVAAALRTLEAPGVRLSLRPMSSSRALNSPPLRYLLTLNLSEAVAVSAWPCGMSIPRLGGHLH